MSQKIVDPIDQLCVMLSWYEDYTEEFKRKCLMEAIVFVADQRWDRFGAAVLKKAREL